jgi:hypothetical protein
MEENALWDTWSNTFGTNPPAPSIASLNCPSNVTETPDAPTLAYVGNAGWAFSDTTRGADKAEHAANGIFFDNNKNYSSGVGPQDNREGQPKIQMSLAQILDGTTKTLMLSENLHTLFWCYEPITATNGYVQNDGSTVPDTKNVFGFVWKNVTAAGVNDRINGDKNYDKAQSPELKNASNPQLAYASDPVTYETYAYPSSNHPGGVNVAFCGGTIRMMAESIDPVVYGQIMTSNARKSTLVNASGVADRKLPQPADSDIP